MEDVLSRLDRCFLTALPGLTPETVRQADINVTASWDSTAMFTLAAVVEEEFGVTFTDEEIGELISYQAFAGRLNASQA